MSITVYAFYNNKGGVGKTTLCSNAATLYAHNNPDTQVLVIDMCPQANISQFLLGGGRTGHITKEKIQSSQTRKNIVGFVDWLLKGNSSFTTPNQSYSISVSTYNQNVREDNLYLIAGDSFLESYTLALNYAVINPANLKAWKDFMTAIKRLCEYEFKIKREKYKKMTVFIDCNPSFSIYTQMSLLSADRLIVPMTADFSSLEGIKGIFMLLYGLYSSAPLKKYAEDIITFNKKVHEFELNLPIISQFVFNNFTTHRGIATAYNVLKQELLSFSYTTWQKFPQYFTSCQTSIESVATWKNHYVSDVKDFHTPGKVSSSLGIPMFKISTGKYRIDGEDIQIQHRQYEDAVENIYSLVSKVV